MLHPVTFAVYFTCLVETVRADARLSDFDVAQVDTTEAVKEFEETLAAFNASAIAEEMGISNDIVEVNDDPHPVMALAIDREGTFLALGRSLQTASLVQSCCGTSRRGGRRP